MDHIRRITARLQEHSLLAEKWSGAVDTKWSPPEGFFTRSAQEIADGLMGASKDEAQAMQRLNFYINRAGENLSGADKARLNRAKTLLEKESK